MSEKKIEKTEKPAKNKTEEKPAPLTGEEKLKADIAAAIAAVSAKYEFLPDHKTERGPVAISDIIVEAELDSRAAPGVVDAEFLESLKTIDGKPHLIQPVSLAWVKVKATGKIGRLMVAGRRRRQGFVDLGFTEIEAITTGMTLQAALTDSGVENMRRAGVNVWDKAVFFQRLLASGLNQKEVAAKTGFSNSTVSQTLSVLTLDERVIKMAKAGKFGPGGDTICRELAKIEDPDQQAEVAAEVVKDPLHIWAASDVAAYVKELNDKEAERQRRKAEREKEKKRRAKEAKARGEEVSEGGEEEAEEEDTDAYDVESFELREVAPIHVLMERTYNEMQKLSEKNEKLKAVVAEIKAKHPDVLKYVEDQGILKGLEIAVGVKDIPAAVAKEVEARAAAK